MHGKDHKNRLFDMLTEIKAERWKSYTDTNILWMMRNVKRLTSTKILWFTACWAYVLFVSVTWAWCIEILFLSLIGYVCPRYSLCSPWLLVSQKTCLTQYIFRMRESYTSWHHMKQTSNGSWCIGIKGEMSGTVCVTFTWDIYIYELFIAFVCFVVCSLL